MNHRSHNRESLFVPTNKDFLDFIETHNQNKEITFLHPLKPVFSSTTRLAFLFDAYINFHSSTKTRYRTYFANSAIEAMHGAIKLTRHSRCGSAQQAIACIDATQGYAEFFNPDCGTEDKNLVRDVTFRPDISGLQGAEWKDGLAGVVYIANKNRDISADLGQLQEFCKKHGTILTLYIPCSDGNLLSSVLKKLAYAVDILIWDERLTNYVVPFAALSARADIMKVWCSLENCFLHSSTYGGNNLSASYALKNFMNIMDPSFRQSAPTKELRLIDSNFSVRKKYFRDFINPASAAILDAAGINRDFIHADGAYLYERTRAGAKKIMDCVGGSGCSLLGHAPTDIPFASFTPQRDYWAELEKKLFLLTGIEKALPAISGATAVETALYIALAALPNRKKIVSFGGNYAGKTLAALNCTHNPRLRAPFGSTYPHVVFIDIGDKDAESLLERELDDGVALVWFEMIQGAGHRPVPLNLIKMVADGKKKHGYYIGIDEILNGVYRAGPFTSYKNASIVPNIVTLSKGLSNMTFPVSATLLTEALFKKLSWPESPVISIFQAFYKNQMGAFIALHTLSAAEQYNLETSCSDVGGYLLKELEKLAGQNPYIKGAYGAGLHLHVNIDYKKFPFSLIGKDLSDLLISRVCYTYGNMLLLSCRLLPPVNLTRQEADEILQALSRSLKLRFIIWEALKMLGCFLLYKIRY